MATEKRPHLRLVPPPGQEAEPPRAQAAGERSKKRRRSLAAERAALTRIAHRLGERDEDEARQLSASLLWLIEHHGNPAGRRDWPSFAAWHIVAPLCHASESLRQPPAAGEQAPARDPAEPPRRVLTATAELIDVVVSALLGGAGSWHWSVLAGAHTVIAGGRDAALAAFVAACDDLIRAYACRPDDDGLTSTPWHVALTAMTVAVPQLATQAPEPGSEPAPRFPSWLVELLDHASRRRMKGATFAAHVALTLGLFGESPRQPTRPARDRLARSFRRRVARWIRGQQRRSNG